MSIVALFLFGSLAATVGLLFALAFARAVLYANILDELDVVRRERFERIGGAPAGLEHPRRNARARPSRVRRDSRSMQTQA